MSEFKSESEIIDCMLYHARSHGLTWEVMDCYKMFVEEKKKQLGRDLTLDELAIEANGALWEWDI